MQQLLRPVKQYFKAALHTHSTVSDGRLTPQEVKEAYKARGYHILALTDHNIAADHSHMNEPGFLMLTGLEINTDQTNANSRSKTCHLNLIAKRPELVWQPFAPTYLSEEGRTWLPKAEVDSLPNDYSPETINTLIAEASRRGYLVFFNHPEWSLQDYTDYASLKGLWGMELVNYSCQVCGFNDRDNSIVYRDMTNLGNRLVPLGTDDCHSLGDLGGGWTMIGAEKLEYASVIEAMERGDVYASTGPEIYSVTLDGDTLQVRCSDARYITVETSNRFAWCARPTHNDGLLREGTFRISAWQKTAVATPNDWIRIVVHGPYGHFAATRAYFRDELE